VADTVADVLVRLGVDTAGLREGFRDARSQTGRFAQDLARVFSLQGGIFGMIGGSTTTAVNLVSSEATGGLLRNIGGLLSTVGNAITALFRRATQRIARDIRANFDAISQAYRAGSLTLAQTIEQIEAQRAEAIRRLADKKGGRAELDRLLPQFDAALADLRARQQAVFEQFAAQLDLLRVGEAFRDVAGEVRDLVRAYRTYVDAGGDLARANEFLSLSLEQLRTDASRTLAEGEQQSIEDALRLNNLLREREEILTEAAEEERRIRSRGVLERQRSVAQQRSSEVEEGRRRRDERLHELDQEISLLQLKVDSEARVFELASDRVALETRLLELRAAEFDREAARLAALRDIVAGIVPGSAGLLGLTPSLHTQLNLGNVQIVVGGGATPAQARSAGEEVIEGMLRALLRERTRLGLAN
jgi:hypothetical protein